MPINLDIQWELSFERKSKERSNVGCTMYDLQWKHHRLLKQVHWKLSKEEGVNSYQLTENIKC